MNVKNLSLLNFRNLAKVEEVQFPQDGLLVAAAPNAMGKTNFLEGVSVLLRGRSWRARTLEECITWGEDGFTLRGEAGGESGTRSIGVKYHQPSRKLRIEEDGEPVSAVKFYSHYPMVLLLPDDTFLLKRGPSSRRNFLNQVLVTHPQYLSALVQYYRILKQRNWALKNAGDAADVQNWTELLAKQAEVLWRYRESFTSMIGVQLTEGYGQLSDQYCRLGITLKKGAEHPEDFVGELTGAFSRERRFGHTTRGPHRDDLVISAEGWPVQASFSGGQMKSLIVALKLIAHNYLTQVTGEKPVLLLDDVLSELDEGRQKALVRNLPSTQAILTCTSLPSGLQNRNDVYLLDLRSIITSSSRVAAGSKEWTKDNLPAREEARQPAAAR